MATHPPGIVVEIVRTEMGDYCCVGFLMRHMVVHAEWYDGALAQVTRVLSGDTAVCSREERRIFHAKRGCCQATIISCLPEVKLCHLLAEEVLVRKELRHGAMEKRENAMKEKN
jgi:hypothetical protein